MSFNLLRNSRVFFTTAVGTSGANIGVVGAAGAPALSSSNTREIQVLDGFGFSQNTTSETVTLNETGAAPVRGQRSFNTQLDPVDFNMTTYIRPYKKSAVSGGAITGVTLSSTTSLQYNPLTTTIIVAQPTTAGGTQAIIRPVFTAGALTGVTIVNPGSGYTGAEAITILDTDAPAESPAVTATITASAISGTPTTQVVAEEAELWNAMFATDPIGTFGTAAWTTGASVSTVTADNSNSHQLQRFGLIIIIDTACFVIDDCVLNTATVDFGIDAIASIQWAGQGKAIRQIDGPATVGAGTFTYSGSDAVSTTIFGGTTFEQKITDAAFIANKLSVVTLQKEAVGSTATTVPYYNLPLTGGSLTISNNVSYLTPANLGVVNRPVTYFAGTRAISGSVTAYLRSGSASGANDTSDPTSGRKQTAQLLGDLLDGSKTDVDPAFRMKISIGGNATDRVELNMPGVVLTIPTIATEQVVSTTINFTAQATDPTTGNFQLENKNELDVKYYA
jgi:hypothetical protein